MMIGLPDDDVPAQGWRIVHTGSALIRQTALWELARELKLWLTCNMSPFIQTLSTVSLTLSVC